MPRKPAPKPDDQKQSERFIEAARKAEADESGERFERVFEKIVSPQKPTSKSPAKKGGRRST
jgi:hypothetical protein